MLYVDPDGMVVVDPRQVVPDPEALEQVTESMSRHYRAVALACAEGRLMVGLLDPSDELARDDLGLVAGLEMVWVRLGIGGGRVPGWEEAAHSAGRPWEPTPRAWSEPHVDTLLDAAYPAAPEPPDANEQAAAGRVLDLILAQAQAAGAAEVWIMVLPKFMHIQSRVGDEWTEMMSPTVFIARPLMRELKRRVLPGVEVVFYPGERGDEARLRFTGRGDR